MRDPSRQSLSEQEWIILYLIKEAVKVLKKVMAVISLSFLSVLILPMRSVQAKSYEIITYDVTVDIVEDGSAYFKEKITYDFEGDFNGFLFNLDYEPHETPTDLLVKVEEVGKEPVIISRDNSQTSGTYEVEDTGTYLNFTVYNPVEDQALTVVYEYRIPDMVTNYNDIAQFNRKVIGGAWEDVLYDVDIRISLPHPVEPGELQAWAHGDATGQVTIENDQFVDLSLDANPAETFVEANVIFPTYITFDNTNQVEEDRLQTILANEASLQREQEAQRERFLLISIIMGIIGPIFTLFVLWWLRKKYMQTNPNPYQEPDYVYELPEDMSPAIMMKAVFKKNPDAVDVSATILDLVRKGYLKMEELDLPRGFDYRLTKLKEPSDALFEHEKQLLFWLIDQTGDGQSVTFNEIEESDASPKKAKRFNEEREEWVRTVAEDAQSYTVHYRAPHASLAFGLMVVSVMASIILFVGLVAAAFILDVAWLHVLAIVGVSLGIYTAYYYSQHPPLTPEGDRAGKDWRAFKRMLEDVGDFRMEDIGSVGLWDVYVVYATAFGIAEMVLDQMAIQYPEDLVQTTSLFYPYYYYNPFYIGFVNQSVSSGMAAAAPSSSASGAGGGFSGGSSGGSGGGSGGSAF